MAKSVGNTGEGTAQDQLLNPILRVLADIRAIPIDQLRSEVHTVGLPGSTVSSQEVVAVLVTLESDTGIDPADPDILKDCEVQTIEQLLAFIQSRMEPAS
jgi:hypothetical protein